MCPHATLHRLCFEKFSVNLYCFNSLPCQLLFFIATIDTERNFFFFLFLLQNYILQSCSYCKIIPEIFLLQFKQNELSQHFLITHAITIPAFHGLSSVTPNAVGYHAQILDVGGLISSSSKKEWLHISYRKHSVCMSWNGVCLSQGCVVLLTCSVHSLCPLGVLLHNIDLLLILYLLSVDYSYKIRINLHLLLLNWTLFPQTFIWFMILF